MTVHLGEKHSQHSLPLLPRQVADVNFALHPSPSLGLLQIIEHIVGTAVAGFECPNPGILRSASVSLDHALLVSVLCIPSVLCTMPANKGMESKLQYSIDHFAMQIFARSIPLWGLNAIYTRSNFGSLIQQKHLD